MSRIFRLAQADFARLRLPLAHPRMAEFGHLLEAVNILADASPGFVWRMDERRAAAEGDQLFPKQAVGTTLVNLSIWRSVGMLQRYASLGKDACVTDARQSFFARFEGPWMVLWWIPDDHFPTVAEGWTRLQHLRRHRETPFAFNLSRPFPAPVGAESYLPDEPEAVTSVLVPRTDGAAHADR